MRPEEIEKRSFEIIEQELGDFHLPEEYKNVYMRVIHTTADFDYIKNLKFSDHAVKFGIDALQHGASIVTDTQMAYSGINKKSLELLGGQAICFMSQPSVAAEAKKRGTTRAIVSMEQAAKLEGPVIFAIGNAPTALLRLKELILEREIKPALVIGVPVGFVHVVESKDEIMDCGVPYIVASGRKGGSNVAAAICNALIYEAVGRVL